MCGILGCVGVADAKEILHDGLHRLEYRGYDSAGMVLGREGELHRSRIAGRVAGLNVADLPVASYGLAHTRWATHGPPTEANAHPHLCCSGEIAVAHNGIIENHHRLREALEAAGHTFTSDTDSEVLVHLLEDAYDGSLEAALEIAVERLEGSFAVLAAHAKEPDALVAARHRSPLVVGLGEAQTFVASDVVAFRAYTDQVVYLEDGDLARITPTGAEIATADGGTRTPQTVDWGIEEATRAGFPHFMLKEIHEQPQAMNEAFLERTTLGDLRFDGDDFTPFQLATKEELIFIACGSSFNAAQAASHAFERCAGVATRVELASEFQPVEPLSGRAAVVAVTQSGETADTLRALRDAREAGFPTLAVTNVLGSTATREAHGWLPIRAGPEISVAATKSYTSQLLVLHSLALHLGHLRRARPASQLEDELEALRDLPSLAHRLLDDLGPFETVGRGLAGHDHAFVLGRGPGQAVAAEVALKIKEISYIHAEGLAAGELKHGPLALIEDGTPVLAIAPGGDRFDSMVSSMQEVAARGARVLGITDDPAALQEAGFDPLAVPGDDPVTFPYLASIAGQVIAYHAAIARGCDVDRPRNLAKSVTVE